MKPCKRGHTGGRYANGKCKECVSARRSTPEFKAAMRAYYATPGYKAMDAARRAKTGQREKRTEAMRRLRGLPAPTRPCPEACENCGGPPNGKGGFHLDHCHDTGVFRGWLCAKCNTAIGKLGDNIAGLRQAIAYLERAELIAHPTFGVLP